MAGERIATEGVEVKVKSSTTARVNQKRHGQIDAKPFSYVMRFR